MSNVFERLHNASVNGQGVTLSFADVHLLMELAGEEIGKAGDEYERWSEIFREQEIYERRSGEQSRHDTAETGEGDS